MALAMVLPATTGPSLAGQAMKIAPSMDDIKARMAAARTVSGKVTSGGRTATFEAYLEGDALFFVRAVSAGDQGNTEEQYFVDGPALAAYRGVAMVPSTDPKRNGAPDEQHTEFAFEEGRPMTGRKTVNGRMVAYRRPESLAPLVRYRDLRAAIARTVAGEAAAPFAGTFGAALAAASSPGRDVMLTLAPDHTARLEQDYRNGQPPVVEEGWWATTGSGVSVTFMIKDGRAVQPSTLVFASKDDGLVATDFDREVWGTAGLALLRK
jgi:hypothetical protein